MKRTITSFAAFLTFEPADICCNIYLRHHLMKFHGQYPKSRGGAVPRVIQWHIGGFGLGGGREGVFDGLCRL